MLNLPAPIELTVGTGICYAHTKTRRLPRITDGTKHPPVRIIKPRR